MTRGILVINPNTSAAMTQAVDEVARRVAGSETAITSVNPEQGTPTIEGAADEVIASYFMLDLVARNRDYDGYVIACYGDPALDACRELVDAPVVGMAEGSFHLANLVAHRWSIITVMPRLRPVLEDLLVRYGVERRCASIRSLDVRVGSDTPQSLVDQLRSEAERAIEVDGAEAVLLGCASWAPIAPRLADTIGAPVVDGVTGAVTLLESLRRLGVTTSRRGAYVLPEAKALVGCAEGLTAAYDGVRASSTEARAHVN